MTAMPVTEVIRESSMLPTVLSLGAEVCNVNDTINNAHFSDQNLCPISQNINSKL